MTHILIEHYTGIYILTSKHTIFSHLPLTLKQNREHILCLNNNKLHSDLVTILKQLPQNSKLVVDKSINQAIKKINLEPVNDMESVRQAKQTVEKHIKKESAIIIKQNDTIGEFNTNDVFRPAVGLAHMMSREKVKYDIKKEDTFVIQTHEMIELIRNDIDKYEKKLKEMYGYHFPELRELCTKEEYPVIVSYILDRTDNIEQKLAKLKDYIKTTYNKNNINGGVIDDYSVFALFEHKNADTFIDTIKNKINLSIGTKIDAIDLQNIKNTAEILIKKYEDINLLYKYINDRLNTLTPNLTSLLGPKIAIKLITKAGSLQNLAKCPSSTLQLLGAEKALFRALKSKSNTPKYGLLYEKVKDIKDEDKGRITRFISAKCSLAARIDCFGDDKTGIYGKEMLEHVNEKIKSLKSGKKIEKTDEVLQRAIKKIKEMVSKECVEVVDDADAKNIKIVGEFDKTEPMKKQTKKNKKTKDDVANSKKNEVEENDKKKVEENEKKSKKSKVDENDKKKVEEPEKKSKVEDTEKISKKDTEKKSKKDKKNKVEEPKNKDKKSKKEEPEKKSKKDKKNKIEESKKDKKDKKSKVEESTKKIEVEETEKKSKKDDKNNKKDKISKIDESKKSKKDKKSKDEESDDKDKKRTKKDKKRTKIDKDEEDEQKESKSKKVVKKDDKKKKEEKVANEKIEGTKKRKVADDKTEESKKRKKNKK
ncbi:hypothetical protein BDAP_000613 [Binucleata daphniae]